MLENIQRYFRYYLALLLACLLALGARVQAAPLRPVAVGRAAGAAGGPAGLPMEARRVPD